MVAGVLLLALGLVVAPLGPLLVGIAAALELDPDASAVDASPELVRAISSVGLLALLAGVLQILSGIGVLLLRRWARGLGIGVALLGAIVFGLAAVLTASTAGQPALRDLWQLDAPFGIVLLLAIAGAYLIAGIALTNDWPDQA
jgi:hypothetical protein